MNMETLSTLVTVVLGSSVGAAAVTALFNWWASRKQTELTVVEEQLRKLYGPLFYFTSFNQSLFRVYNDYHKAYDDEYVGNTAPEWDEHVVKQAEALLEEANSYIREEVQENNRRVIRLLQENWHLVDTDDLEEFSTFQIDMCRLKRIGEHSAQTSFKLYEHLGPISYMRAHMMERVKEKFAAKRERFEALIGQGKHGATRRRGPQLFRARTS